MSEYAYHLHYWGDVENERCIERDLGILQKDFWFPLLEAREALKQRLLDVANAHQCCIVFAEHEGYDTHLCTAARMEFTLPDGRVFHHEYDFGYGYAPDDAEFMFSDGDLYCDCNRANMLHRAGHEVPEFECGSTIKMTNFTVEKVSP